MTAINFPPNNVPSTPAASYTASPWVDPNGKKWIYSTTKNRWSPFVESIAEPSVPDAITRTLAEGAPTTGYVITEGHEQLVAGTVLLPTSDPNTFSTDGSLTPNPSGLWASIYHDFETSGSAIVYVDNVDIFAATVGAALPAGVWSVDGDAGEFTIAEAQLPLATHLGQWCRVETAVANVYDWWQWNGDEWVFVRTDGVVNEPIPVATNIAKKALTGVVVGALYVITGEASRVEQYLGNLSGGSEANDDNWAIVGDNTVNLSIYNNHSSSGTTVYWGAIPISYYGTVNVGWVKVNKMYSVTNFLKLWIYIVNGGYTTGGYLNYPETACSIPPKDQFNYTVIKSIFPPRGAITLRVAS